tara:strand:- start:1768 stop:2385 length:618 start_codon:yes stop_codon:yes gene_type:complete
MNNIHPTAVIDDCVTLGDENFVGPFCYLTGGLTIGDHNWFEAYCSVGTRPEHENFWHSDGNTKIGNNNMFREHITINAGTEGLTYVGNNVIMLRGSHVAHDCVIENGVTLSCNAIMLGHVHVMKHSNCGTGCLVHQHQVVGSYSMVGMGCVVPKKTRLEPGQTWVGNPARRLKTNMYALDKHNIDDYILLDEAIRWVELVKEHDL